MKKQIKTKELLHFFVKDTYAEQFPVESLQAMEVFFNEKMKLKVIKSYPLAYRNSEQKSLVMSLYFPQLRLGVFGKYLNKEKLDELKKMKIVDNIVIVNRLPFFYKLMKALQKYDLTEEQQELINTVLKI